MQTLNLTLIGDVACATTRTYLTFLRDAGYRIENLWLVRFNAPQRQGLWFELRQRLFRSQRRSHVLDSISEPVPEFKALCAQLMATAAVLPVDLFGGFDYDTYARKTEYFVADDYLDPRLQKRILNTSGTAFLYTNGGIVPRALLMQEGVKILHMHPGVVPQMRGSDCFLWSSVVRRRLGVSCFYMSPGIDEGEVIQTMEFNTPDLSFLTPYLSESDDLVYRALLFALDPQLRGQVLIEAIKRASTNDMRALSAQQQPTADRPPFLWMHPKVRLPVMRRLAMAKPGHEIGRVTPAVSNRNVLV